MLSARVPLTSMLNMHVNMTWDGVFHAAVWMATLAGVITLWRALTASAAPPPPGRVLAGSMLAGWGAFNLLEGLIDHHLLRLHHVVERLGLSIWDWLFLGSGVLLILCGAYLAKDSAPPLR